jgi:integration host factor subunit alpha
MPQSGKITKSSMVNTIAETNGYTQKKSTEIVEIILEQIKQSLENGEDVLISGFGKFIVQQKRERKGRNPATSEAMMLAPRKRVVFRCSGKLRQKINQKQ